MGIFFSDSKKISRDDFKKTLKEIPDLSDKDRAYLEGVFGDKLKDGLSKEELKKEIYHLEQNYSDSLKSSEVEKLKQKLTEHLDK